MQKEKSSFSHRFFENRDCEYYPCHRNADSINCLFCFCPLYTLDDCPGNCSFIKTKDGKTIKDCSDCLFPHRAENYEKIMELLKK